MKDCASPIPTSVLRVSNRATGLNKPFRNEVILFAVCLLLGLFFLPAAIYLVGDLIFGAFGGGGFGDFYGSVQAAIWGFDSVVWFLVLSPYLVVQALRLTFRLYRALRTT